MVNTVIAKIEAQQVGHDEYGPVYQVGEQLKDICRSCPEQADLLLNDLDNPEMTIVKAERKSKNLQTSIKRAAALAFHRKSQIKFCVIFTVLPRHLKLLNSRRSNRMCPTG